MDGRGRQRYRADKNVGGTLPGRTAGWQLLNKYRDIPMDFTDACLVRLTELHADCVVWTTDTDFRVYRRHGRQVISTLGPRG